MRKRGLRQSNCHEVSSGGDYTESVPRRSAKSPRTKTTETRGRRQETHCCDSGTCSGMGASQNTPSYATLQLRVRQVVQVQRPWWASVLRIVRSVCRPTLGSSTRGDKIAVGSLTCFGNRHLAKQPRPMAFLCLERCTVRFLFLSHSE